MKKYESTMTFKFKEQNWKIAQKSNIKLYMMLIEVCKEFDIEVNCKKLEEISILKKYDESQDKIYTKNNNEVSQCDNCHHYNPLITPNEGVFEQCLMGRILHRARCIEYDPIKENMENKK